MMNHLSSAAIVSLCMAVGCMMEPSVGTESTDMPAQERPSKTEDVPAPSLTGGTLHLIATENCFDIFMRPCTSTFPSPQCAPGPYDGKPCSPATGWSCFQTLPGGVSYNEYSCY